MTRFDQLAPRMMRDLMRDFAPLADFQAAGIVGNGGGESGGFTIAQEGRPTSGRGGWGGFQWTGPRRKNYEAYIKSKGFNPADAATALDYDMMYGFLAQELRGPERATIPAVRASTSLADATKAFMMKFERPGVPNISGRIGWSKKALDAYKAEQVQITKNPPIAIDTKPTKEIVRDDAPVDGVPKPKNNNIGFWGTLTAGVAAAFGSAWNWALEWLPLVVGLLGLAVLLIFMLRPVYVRWRDYLRHSPEFIELAHGSPWKAFGVLFDGFKSKVVARLAQGSGALLILLQGAQSLVGGDTFDINTILPAIPLGKMSIPPTMYLFGGISLLGYLQDKFRAMATAGVGQINPVTAVEMATNADSINGSKPSPALAAITDAGAVADLTQVPVAAPHGVDSSKLLGRRSIRVTHKRAYKRKKARR
jgi:hypothetical protein